MKMPSVMRQGSRSAKVPQATIERSQFDRSHALKTTFDGGLLIPVYIDEALPGDTFNMKMNAFVRLATPLKPIMDNLYLDTFFFAVPMRLLWDNWEKFNGAQEDPGDSISFLIPQQTVPTAGYTTGLLQDYFGLPVGIAAGSPAWSHTCLPTRAYYLIYNEWFRDQNLQDTRDEKGSEGSGPVSKGDGPDTTAVGGTPVLSRGKRHDYFTSCLPFPQKGTAVSLPLGTVAPVVGDGTDPSFINAVSGVSEMKTRAAGVDVAIGMDGAGGAWADDEQLTWSNTGLEVDLTAATAATINSLREAFQIQKLLERDARGGTRYTEIIKSHFGVTSPDSRLQRTEYLGGGSTPIIVSPIAQNSNNDTQDTPQGNLAGIGTGSMMGQGFVKSFTEHCVLIGLVSVRADLTYQQGIERMWSRSTRYDFFWPAFAHLGEQEVLNKEIWLTGGNGVTDALAFGFQERYADYRYKPSRLTGLMRSNPTTGTSLDIWHLSQDFSALPTLGTVFITDTPPIDRVIAVPSEPHFIMDAWFKLSCARPMPMYGVPGMIDHF